MCGSPRGCAIIPWPAAALDASTRWRVAEAVRAKALEGEVGIWHRYRFETRGVDDPRPGIFPPPGPSWITGYASADGVDDGQGVNRAIVVAYLPPDEPLTRYWPDAEAVEWTEEEAITFTSRFPKPDWWAEEPSG
jgi:hypothetical protein